MSSEYGRVDYTSPAENYSTFQNFFMDKMIALSPVEIEDEQKKEEEMVHFERINSNVLLISCRTEESEEED